MATTTLGVKLDDPTRERLKAAATSIDRTPHWLIKQAIFNYLEKLEGGATLTELNGLTAKDADEAGEVHSDHAHQCFLEFAESILPQSVLRASITAAYRRPEPEVVPMLIEQARLPAPMTALFAGPDGLDAYRVLVPQLPALLPQRHRAPLSEHRARRSPEGSAGHTVRPQYRRWGALARLQDADRRVWRQR